MYSSSKNANKSPHPSALFVSLGALWIAIWIILFLKTSILHIAASALIGIGYCQTCTGSSLVTIAILVLSFMIGGLGISYGVFGRNEEKQTGRLISFAFAVSLASLIIYYWANLFINGL